MSKSRIIIPGRLLPFPTPPGIDFEVAIEARNLKVKDHELYKRPQYASNTNSTSLVQEWRVKNTIHYKVSTEAGIGIPVEVLEANANINFEVGKERTFERRIKIAQGKTVTVFNLYKRWVYDVYVIGIIKPLGFPVDIPGDFDEAKITEGYVDEYIKQLAEECEYTSGHCNAPNNNVITDCPDSCNWEQA
jgi:hypothetical protein